MKAFDRVMTTFGFLFLLSVHAAAHDPSMPHHEWFNKQEMNPAAQHRLGLPYKSCCSNGDVFKTRFRVGEDRSDQWQYLKDGEWKTIPPDVIKESDTPDHAPVLFINRSTGQELCFFWRVLGELRFQIGRRAALSQGVQRVAGVLCGFLIARFFDLFEGPYQVLHGSLVVVGIGRTCHR